MKTPTMLFSMPVRFLDISKVPSERHTYLGQGYLCHSLTLNFNNRTEDVFRSKYTSFMSIQCIT